MEYTEKYYGQKMYYIPNTFDLKIISEQAGYKKLFENNPKCFLFRK